MGSSSTARESSQCLLELAPRLRFHSAAMTQDFQDWLTHCASRTADPTRMSIAEHLRTGPPVRGCFRTPSCSGASAGVDNLFLVTLYCPDANPKRRGRRDEPASTTPTPCLTASPRAATCPAFQERVTPRLGSVGRMRLMKLASSGRVSASARSRSPSRRQSCFERPLSQRNGTGLTGATGSRDVERRRGCTITGRRRHRPPGEVADDRQRFAIFVG